MSAVDTLVTIGLSIGEVGTFVDFVFLKGVDTLADFGFLRGYWLTCGPWILFGLLGTLLGLGLLL